jgi:glyoxylase-like metal-dependent hydrolase (beta-lactamase superfamily II)
VEGDLEPIPGIKLIFTPGHTPGSQTVSVNTAHGTAIIPGFCSNKDNFPVKGPAPCPGVHCDAYLAYDTAQKVKNMGTIIFPLHEINLAKLNGSYLAKN